VKWITRAGSSALCWPSSARSAASASSSLR